MSSDRNPEVMACDASIMKDVWEIRARDFEQKMHQEQIRLEKSALPSINQDWAGRLAARLGGYKRSESKPKERVKLEIKTDDIWKSKETVATRKAAAPPPLGRPAAPSRGLSSVAPSSRDKKLPDKKMPDRNQARLQLLMYIGQNQPSAMVWGKSWKYNKCVPPLEASSTAGWGPCWMFAVPQPFSEAGQPWPNGPSKTNPGSLRVWKKLDYRMVESLELEALLPTEEWQMSWKKHDKSKQKGASENEDSPKYGFFTALVESQHHNEALSSSEWSDSWRATKPANGATLPSDSSASESVHENNQKGNSKWEDCWKFTNYQPCNSAKPQAKKSVQPEWVHSWRAAVEGFGNHKKSGGYGPGSTGDDQNESQFDKILPLSYEHKYKGRHTELHSELEALSEWSKSWLVTKNNSKPCEEIEKVLKASTPSMAVAHETKSAVNNVKVHHSATQKVDPLYEQLKHDVLYRPKTEFTQSMLFLLKRLEKMHPSPEWRDSWKVIKHRMRMERQRRRPVWSQRGDAMKPATSEWKDSWKCPRSIVQQEPEMWQQGWPAFPPVRQNRAHHHDHFAPVERPKNGPSGEPGWGESWRFFRGQVGQGRQQATRESSDMASHGHHDSRRHFRATSDWQPSWMVSETQFHHDNPSLIQWSRAWKCSNTPVQHWSSQLARESWVMEMTEIEPSRRRMSSQRAKANLSRSFDGQTFVKRFPEKEWVLSWSAASLLTPQTNNHGSSGTPEAHGAPQQHHAGPAQNGLKWGKSFRIANPMPQVEQPWLESHPNTLSYAVMWRKGKKTPVQIRPVFCNNAATSKVWLTSHQLLQGASARNNDKTKATQHSDARVIMALKPKTRKHLFSAIVNEKQSERKWAGCHLLGKTQPRPKKSLGPNKKLTPSDDDDKFCEEWAESWRFRASSAPQKKAVKSLSGWKESWKWLLPPYQPMNGPKSR